MKIELPNHEFKPKFKDFADCFDFSFLVPRFDHVFSIHGVVCWNMQSILGSIYISRIFKVTQSIVFWLNISAYF